MVKILGNAPMLKGTEMRMLSHKISKISVVMEISLVLKETETQTIFLNTLRRTKDEKKQDKISPLSLLISSLIASYPLTQKSL